MFIPNKLFSEVDPNLARSTNNFINIALINASPGPLKTPPIPFIIPWANLAPVPSPCNKSLRPFTAAENTFKISFAASANPSSPSIDESCWDPTTKLFINASRVSFKAEFFLSKDPAAPAETSRAFAN